MKGLMITVVAILALAGALALAQGGYDLVRGRAAGGGGTSSGGAYTLSGTAGQAEAGAMSGGPYSLVGGFWGLPSGYTIYLPLAMKGAMAW